MISACPAFFSSSSVNCGLSCHDGTGTPSPRACPGAKRLYVFAPPAHVKSTPLGSGSEAGATGGQSGKSQFIFLLSQRKSTIAVLHNNKKIGAKKCRRLNKPVSEYRSRILHTAIARQCSPPLAGNSFQIIHIAAACGCVCRRTLRGRLMTHTVLIRADFYKHRFTPCRCGLPGVLSIETSPASGSTAYIV